ncbi:hypothetical protein ABID44_002857 [Aquamicrobium ahrensii]|uniref:Uncharacterized protein n=1 Tax=Aquamicrobium ahrensii TaxID=469551 RepID=A0ABV2KN61_9HYPH
MLLHQRGVDVLLKVMDASDHIDQFDANQTQALLRDVADVLAAILERDARHIVQENNPNHL